MSLPAGSPDPTGRKIISVGALTRRIKKSLEDTIRTVCVQGEISNLKSYASGHLYFTLKDEESEIPCAMWKGYRSRLRFRADNGMAVIAVGRVEVYVPRGRYQLIVEDMEPKGTGALERNGHRRLEWLTCSYNPSLIVSAVPSSTNTIGTTTRRRDLSSALL